MGWEYDFSRLQKIADDGTYFAYRVPNRAN